MILMIPASTPKTLTSQVPIGADLHKTNSPQVSPLSLLSLPQVYFLQDFTH